MWCMVKMYAVHTITIRKLGLHYELIQTYPSAKEQEEHNCEENHDEGTNHSICSIRNSRQQERDEC